VTKSRYQRILAVLQRRQPDLTVLAEDVYKPHNFSAIMRSCDAVGVGTVHAVNPTGGIPTFSATSASADKWVEVKVHNNIEEAIKGVRGSAKQILAAHLSDEALDYRDVDYTIPTCILLGNEKAGVSVAAAQHADHHIVIPMLGMVRSLNVSVAAAVILFEAQRQRREIGFYKIPRLHPDSIARKAFSWLYPKEARRLDEIDEPYPELDEAGEFY
jgi:tRNA (guanosine-2'-O-)-methyltransferase